MNSDETSTMSTMGAGRAPYLIQIGFDYGTAFSKCVYRDMVADRAWVHLDPARASEQDPYLIPSVVIHQGGVFSRHRDAGAGYPTNGLVHLKHALELVALDEWDSPPLRDYAGQSPAMDQAGLEKLVIAANVFFLANAYQEVLQGVRLRFPDFGSKSGDEARISMAIPVADAEHEDIAGLFRRVMIAAWSLAKQMFYSGVGIPSRIKPLIACVDTGIEDDGCFLYPEVSANVQAFTRSRTSRHGTYLFTDVGAGTVDQSLFVYHQNEGHEVLTYLAAWNPPLGSGQIEYRAAAAQGVRSREHLERLRLLKEEGVLNGELRSVILELQDELGCGTERLLLAAKNRLYVLKQLTDACLIFGGGGYRQDVYDEPVRGAFRQKQIFGRVVNCGKVGIPRPSDIEFTSRQSHWMDRLSVAYGLSFFPEDLDRYRFPSEMPRVLPRMREVMHDGVLRSPTKDEC